MADTSGGRSRLLTAALVGPAAAFFALLLVLPLVVVLIYSFGERAPAGGYAPGFTLANYQNLPARSTAFLNTLTLAPIGTLFCALIAYPLAYFLAVKVTARWRVLLLVLVVVPFWTSQLLRIYAWLMILGNQGLPRVFALAGIEDLRIVNTPAAVLIGMVYGYLPLMVLPIYASMEKLDFRMVEAGYDLYAGRLAVLRRIIIPLVKPGIIAGSILVFIPALGAYVTPALLGGGKKMMVSNLISLQFGQGRNWPLGAALSIALMAVVMVALLIYVRNASRSSERTH